MLKIILLSMGIIFIIKPCYGKALENSSFECDTSIVISIDDKGELKQFLPGKIYFKIKNETLIFGQLGYLTDEQISINIISEDQFYSYLPAQTILFENGLFHNLIFTYEGITVVQANCSILNDLDMN